MKKWRKVLAPNESRIFINIRKSELLMLGFEEKQLKKLVFKTTIKQPNKIVLEFKVGGGGNSNKGGKTKKVKKRN